MNNGKVVGLLTLALAGPGCLGVAKTSGAGGNDNADAGPQTAMQQSLSAACGAGYSSGHAPIHRLSNTEYDNTVRDLLFTTLQPSVAIPFPADEFGPSGYMNDSTSLGTGITDELVQNYYAAATRLAAELIQTKGKAMGAYSLIAPCAPSASSSTASPDGATIPSLTQIVDASQNVWTLSGGVVYENGAKAGFTSGVQLVLLYSGSLYQYAGTNGWWKWDGTEWNNVASGDPRPTGYVPATPTTPTTPAACINAVVTRFTTRAFRRPPTADETARLVGVFTQSADFDTGLSDFITAVLLDPKFLFVSIVEASSQDPKAQFALGDYELASRLSYFLWQSMPDDTLLQLAAAGTLHEADTLTAQVKRMLADPRVSGALQTLRDQFAGLLVISTSVNGLDDTLRESMITETSMYLADLIANDTSVLGIITGGSSFVNASLASVYGVPFTGATPTDFVKVTLPADQRVGMLTQASILTATAGASDVTHPVKRGKWVASRILCAEPPPPPANVPMLATTPPAGETIRQTLDAHASNASCAGCHALMDPIGLALESYDPFGNYRTTYADSGLAIDPSGQLPGGASFANAVQLYQSFETNTQVQSCLATQFMSYGLARAMASSDDSCVAQALANLTVTPKSKFSDLVSGIVTSNLFLMQTGEAP